MRIMKVTIHPPSATSTPTYNNKKKQHSHVTRPARFVNSALRRPLLPAALLSVECCMCRWKTAPVSSQKQWTEVPSSMVAQPIYSPRQLTHCFVD
jgi:hypothetical protein